MAVPGVAQAAEVVIPNTNYSVNVNGIENIPGIKDVPNIGQYVPSFNQVQAQAKTYNATATVPQTAAAPAPAPQQSTGDKVVAAARSAIGSPYGWGSAGPSSFDCSGLTSWAYAQAGKSIPRTSQAQAAQGQQVSMSDIQPGDIVVYYGGASHVAIYAGNGVMIDSLNSGTTVAERPLNYMPIHSIVRF
ncbi:NlpC/P60 family protein [Corynebacterium sp. CMW7794]|uniref:C40 family peptidase n=1 Tax=Corynebacterium phoceense TaxID=1686286 RepID=UPI0007928280|nr:C40 family peptidase [Corynebacterium phoceense]KXB53032.1 NlpC/P60 family protein [Corynebacterium sp. DNF00584]KXI17254.1 NlpC/P60 family protein [Corynebacterium sp. CMW7794]